MTLMDKACYERGCAHYDYRDKLDTVKVARLEDIRNQVLEEVAVEFDCMSISFGDTAHSFAQYVREMKSAKT
jgi:hypothetical protein